MPGESNLTKRRIRSVTLLCIPVAMAFLPGRLAVVLLAFVPVAILVVVGLWWMGQAADLISGFETMLLRTLVLWTPDPGATWLAWARRTTSMPRARAWIGFSAEEGHAEGRLQEALGYLDGSWGAGGDQVGAIQLEALAREGHAEAQAHLGHALFWGQGRKRDPVGAFRWMKEAARGGFGPAAAWLARAYETGDGVEPHPEAAARWRSRAAEGPLPRPSLLSELRAPSQASRLETVLGAGHDHLTTFFETILADPASRRIFLAMAALVIGLPLLVLAWVLFVGWTAAPIFFIPIPICLALMWTGSRFGPTRQSRESRRTWESAQAGDPKAAFALALAFERGDRDHPQDPVEARRWHQRAAEAGHAEAAYRLAELWAWGQGGLRDRRQAKTWLRKAVELGHQGAGGRLAELESLDSGPE